MRLSVFSVSVAIGVYGLLCSVASAQAPVPPVDKPVVHAIELAQGISVDGRLDEAVYAANAPFTEFIQQEPDEGMPATEKTEVWVLFDDKNIYVSARMWDSHPERMIANEMRRDNSLGIYQNESFSFTFDTFHDGRSGFYFMTNILGALRDLQFVSEKQVNGEWNPIWNPQCRRFENGWTMEAAIPFKSLRYPSQGEQTWGLQLRRVVRWKNEASYMTRVPAQTSAAGIYRMQDEATLVGLRTPAAGKNLDIKPYVSSRITSDRLAKPAFNNDLTADIGGDVKYGVTPALTADFTYNTDFAQVEDDLQQVNLTRFGLFFPEKREFFLEGQGIFDFGGQTGGGNNPGAGDIPSMFFSRQIGLVDGVSVPIEGGGRLTGKIGKYSVGLVDIQTDASALAVSPSTNFGIVRVRRDILGNSYVGVLGTQRTPSGGDHNSMFGADTNLAFGLTNINVYYAQTRTPGRRGNDASYLGSYDYSGDRYGATVQHLTVQPNFNPEIGFLRRQDFQTNSASLRFSPRPARTNTTLKAFRKFYYQGDFDYTTNNAHHLESRAAIGTFKTDLNNGGIFSSSAERDYEFIDTPFRIASGVTIPVGGYAFNVFSASYQFQPQLKVRGTLSGNVGSFYGGTRNMAQYAGRVELSSRFIFEPTLSLNWVDLRWGSFKTNVISTRTTYTLSPRSSLGALVQYNSSTHLIASNIRFRWEYVPGSDLFVVYTDGRTTLIPDRFADLQNRTFVIKATRLLRY